MFEQIQMGKKNNTIQLIKVHSRYLKLSQHSKKKKKEQNPVPKTNEGKPQGHIDWTEN